MKLTERDQDQQNALAHAFHDRERFTLTGAGLQAEFVAEVLNRAPCTFGSGRYETNLELVQVTQAITNAAWTGEGLPPVGTVCEFAGGTNCPEDPFDKDLKEGDEVTIIAHFKDGESSVAAFTFNPRNLSRGNACVEQGMHGCFRPIRTPEQTAAEDRELAIEDMVSQVKSGTGLRALCEQVFDAGYRKQ